MKHIAAKALDVFATVAIFVASIVFIVVLANRFGLSEASAEGPGVEDLRDQNATLALTDTPTIGVASSSVVLVEFSDFECPFCRRFEGETFGQIKKKLVDTGHLLYAYKHLPLAEIHRRAMSLARAAECAAAQGRFWDMRSSLFALPMLTDDRVLDAAIRSGVSREPFGSCLAELHDARINRDMADAERFGIIGTPAFLIGLRESSQEEVRVVAKVTGAREYAVFEAVIASANRSSKSWIPDWLRRAPSP